MESNVLPIAIVWMCQGSEGGQTNDVLCYLLRSMPWNAIQKARAKRGMLWMFVFVEKCSYRRICFHFSFHYSYLSWVALRKQSLVFSTNRLLLIINPWSSRSLIPLNACIFMDRNRIKLETAAAAAAAATTTTQKQKIETPVLVGWAEGGSGENVTRHNGRQCS